MKLILLFSCVFTLLTTTGCFFPGRGGGWHGDGWRGGRADNEAPPVVAVRAPEVAVVTPVVVEARPEVIVP